MRILSSAVFLLAAVVSSSSSVEDYSTSLAICLTGADRSMHHPAVVAGFAQAFERHADYQVFAVLSQESAVPLEPIPYARLHAPTLERYGVSLQTLTLTLVDKGLGNTFFEAFYGGKSCSSERCQAVNVTAIHGHRLAPDKQGPVCDRQAVVEKSSHRPETGEQWAEQVWKATVCWRMVKHYEARRRDRPFEYLLRWRPDVLFLSPFPALPPATSKKSGERVIFVDRRTHDHFLLCPRDLCAPFFQDASREFDKRKLQSNSPICHRHICAD